MKGIGTDIIEVGRIHANLDQYGEKFLEKILTLDEILYCKKYKDQAPHVAGRFAAKEAIAKALGKGFGEDLEFHDIEILNDENGKPYVRLSEKSKAIFEDPQIKISISHCKSHAIAMAVWC